MKTSTDRLCITIGKEAKKRLADIQSELRFKGCKDRATSPGKIVAELLLMENTFGYLEKKFLHNG